MSVLLTLFGDYIAKRRERLKLEVQPSKSEWKLSKSLTFGLLSLLAILTLSAAVYAEYYAPYQFLTTPLYALGLIILIFDFLLKRHWLRTNQVEDSSLAMSPLTILTPNSGSGSRIYQRT